MTDSSPYPDTEDTDHVDAGSDSRSGTGMPRWVKMSGLVVGALVAIFVVAQLLGVGGDHGPGRHGGGDDPPAGMEEDGDHTSPPGMDHGG